MQNRPSIYFNDQEIYLLEYALKQEGSFASYIKRLIKEDMNKGSFEDKVLRIIEKYMSGKEIVVTESLKEQPILMDNEIDELKAFLNE